MVKPLAPFVETGDRRGLDRDELLKNVGTLDAGMTRIVAEYLRACPLFIAWMEYTEDVIGGKFGVSGGSGLISDGYYYWRLDAADYVETYSTGLGRDFMDHGEARGWLVPTIEGEPYLDLYNELEERVKRARGQHSTGST